MENVPTQNFESQEEKENYSSKIELRIFRHGEKEDSKEGQPDEKVHLTEEGKRESVKEAEDGKVDQSVAYGSPRERAQQTAAYTMAGNMPEITGEETFEELKDKLEKNINVGEKVATDERLDFSDATPDNDFGKWLIEEYKKSQFLSAFIKKSDEKAEYFGNEDTSTYSSCASNVAKLINKYIEASDRWNQLVKKSDKDYEKELKRYMGTHTGVSESFLAKVIEVTEGNEERDKFIEAVGSNGFDNKQGFLVNIKEKSGEKEVEIVFEKELEDSKNYEFKKTISPELIKEEIIQHE